MLKANNSMNRNVRLSIPIYAITFVSFDFFKLENHKSILHVLISLEFYFFLFHLHPSSHRRFRSLDYIRSHIQISAQESRRKKKEYMDKLERQVEILVTENTSFRKKVETLEDTNANLMSQLAKLQALVNRQTAGKKA